MYDGAKFYRRNPRSAGKLQSKHDSGRSRATVVRGPSRTSGNKGQGMEESLSDLFHWRTRTSTRSRRVMWSELCFPQVNDDSVMIGLRARQTTVQFDISCIYLRPAGKPTLAPQTRPPFNRWVCPSTARRPLQPMSKIWQMVLGYWKRNLVCYTRAPGCRSWPLAVINGSGVSCTKSLVVVRLRFPCGFLKTIVLRSRVGSSSLEDRKSDPRRLSIIRQPRAPVATRWKLGEPICSGSEKREP